MKNDSESDLDSAIRVDKTEILLLSEGLSALHHCVGLQHVKQNNVISCKGIN